MQGESDEAVVSDNMSSDSESDNDEGAFGNWSLSVSVFVNSDLVFPAPCEVLGYKNRPVPFPDRMS